jgi:glycosyltransferase involved in cell wall biosynthesis
MSREPSLSALVVAHNEDAQLGDCLETLKFADELVVLLDRCTDGSKEISLRYTEHVVEGAWKIEGVRRNTGIKSCTSDWIIEVDADERVSKLLAREIRNTISETTKSYFLVPYDNYVGDRLIRFGWGAAWGVSSTVRLFRAGTKRWGDQRIHPKIEFKGQQGRLKSPMIHYVDRDISDMIHRLDRYTTARAADLRETDDIGSLSANIRRIFSRFWKCYVTRRGYREGPYGFLIALFAGLYPILSYLKARLEDG